MTVSKTVHGGSNPSSPATDSASGHIIVRTLFEFMEVLRAVCIKKVWTLKELVMVNQDILDEKMIKSRIFTGHIC